MKNNTHTKVFVGMSGGVDSSTTAKILVDQGYDVTGVFIKVWQPDFFECTWKEDRRDAMRVAAQLGIPFLTINAEKEYKEKVVEYMVDEYKNGRTPNPDVMCNNSIKFGVFFDKAIEMGADYIATGHYARVSHRSADTCLKRAVDRHKDQTYFLWNVPKDALSKTLFPVGEYEKDKIRSIAKESGLFTADKKDSQGLCFVGKIPIEDFLGNFIDFKKGDVLDLEGAVVGVHKGAAQYTTGQRHGFVMHDKTPEEKPYYVIEKDVVKNTITISDQTPDNEISSTGIVLSDMNQITAFPFDKKIHAKIRHGQSEERVVLREGDNKIEVHFDIPQKDLAVGQSCVFYDDDKCLGGGIIEKVIS